MKTYTRNPRQWVFMLLGVFLALAITLSVIAVLPVSPASASHSVSTTDTIPASVDVGETVTINFVSSAGPTGFGTPFWRTDPNNICFDAGFFDASSIVSDTGVFTFTPTPAFAGLSCIVQVIYEAGFTDASNSIIDEASQSFTITINAQTTDPNTAPTAMAVIPENTQSGRADVYTGTEATLDGRGSSDPDAGDSIATYAWTQTGPTATTHSVALSDASVAMPTFMAPAVTAATDLEFSLTVTDTFGVESAPTTATITVNPRPRLVISTEPASVNEGSGTITIRFTVDPNGGPTPNLGNSGPKESEPHWVWKAPPLRTILIFSVGYPVGRRTISLRFSPSSFGPNFIARQQSQFGDSGDNRRHTCRDNRRLYRRDADPGNSGQLYYDFHMATLLDTTPGLVGGPGGNLFLPTEPFVLAIADNDPTFSTTTIAAQTYTVGTDIGSVTLPTATGGNPPLRYTISSLPNGLTLNDNVLSGNPTTVQPSNTHVYTVTDSDDNTDTINFTIEIDPPAPTCEGTLTWTVIVPDCLSPGDTYRIIFVTSGTRDATSSNIGTYNNFVQTQANLNPDLVGITFRALGSTGSTNSRTNTDTGGTGTNIRIFYYQGRKVADDYANLYGTWDTNEPRNQNGEIYPGTGELRVWTGTRQNGSVPNQTLGSGSTVRGNARNAGQTLNIGTALGGAAFSAFYALSAVLTVSPAEPTAVAVIPENAQSGRTDVYTGTEATLDGSGSSDAGGSIATYAWTQTGATATTHPVTLDTTNPAMPTFTAPAVTAPTDLEFSLTVTDDEDLVSAPATVTIRVNLRPRLFIATDPASFDEASGTITISYILASDGGPAPSRESSNLNTIRPTLSLEGATSDEDFDFTNTNPDTFAPAPSTPPDYRAPRSEYTIPSNLQPGIETGISIPLLITDDTLPETIAGCTSGAPIPGTADNCVTISHTEGGDTATELGIVGGDGGDLFLSTEPFVLAIADNDPTFSPTTIDPQTYALGMSISVTLPIATGGNPPLSYTVSPLPGGLTLNDNVLSGTPTTVQSSTTHVYTVMDSDGNTATIDLDITINVPEGNICSRTAQVQAEIIRASNTATDCTSVDDLADITSINLNNQDITILRSDDFAGLTGLQTLDLDVNSLSTLPANIFAGLTALRILNLSNNSLQTLDAGLFNGLGLTILNLRNNMFTADTGLPAGIFDPVLGTLGDGGGSFLVDQTVRDAHFVCSRPDFAAIVAATVGVTDCLRVSSAQFNASVTDATLSGLTISDSDGTDTFTLTPPFASDTTAYAVSVSNSVENVVATVVANFNGVTSVTVNGETLISSAAQSELIPLTAGMSVDIPIIVTAADGTTMMTYTVTATRLAPEGVPSVSGTYTASINEGDALATPLSSVIIDEGQDQATVVYTLQTGAALPDGLTLNADGSFSGTATFVATTPANSPQAFAFQWIYTDGPNTTDPQTGTITVNDVNRMPTFMTIDMRLSEGETLPCLCGFVTDPIEDPADVSIAYSISSGLPPTLVNSLDENAGFFDPARFPQDTATIADPETIVTFQWVYTDANGPFPQTGTFTVLNNNNAPVIDPLPDETARTVILNRPLSLMLTGSDVDTNNGDPRPTWSITPTDLGATIAVDTGVFSWTPTGTQIGTHDFTVTLTDGEEPVTTLLRIIVPAPIATLTGTLTAANLSGATVTVTLLGTDYVPDLLATHFTLAETVPGTVTVSSVSRTDSTTATLTLSYIGEEITANGTLSVTVLASGHTETENLITNTVPIIATPPITATITAEGSTVVTEGNMAEFSVILSEEMALGEDVGVTWAADCSGDAGIVSADDFPGAACPTGTATIAANTASSAIFSIAIEDDSVLEIEELLRVRVTSVQPSTVGDANLIPSDVLAEHSIADNETGVISITVAAGTLEVSEIDEPAVTFNINLEDGSGNLLETSIDIAVPWGFALCGSDNSAGITADDFIGAACDGGTVTIAANTRSASLDIRIANDGVMEDDETFTIVIMEPTPDFGDALSISTRSTASQTILDSGIGFTVRALSESITEGETAQFEILTASALSEPAIFTWTVNCVSANTGVLAVAAADLQAATACESNTLTAGVGTSTSAISVPTLDDTVREPDFIDGEVLTLEVTLGGNMNSASTRVLDNDTVFVGFANDSIRVEEGSAILDRLLPEISFLLNEHPDASSISVSVLLTASGCTPSGSTGVTDGDFASGLCPGPLTVSLTNTGTVLVTGSRDTILSDNFAEGIESFSFSASLNGTQALPTIPPDAATITLEIEDDADSMLSIFTTATSTLLEGSEDEVEDADLPDVVITFEVRLPEGVTAAEPISVRWELECADVLNADFTTSSFESLCRESENDAPLDPRFSDVALIETGAAFTTIEFTLNPDTERERRESFRVHLLPSEGFVIANSNSVATGTILDDDIALLNIEGPMLVDEGSTAVFTLSLDPSRLRRIPQSGDVEFSWFIEDCSTTRTAGINSFDFVGEVCPVGTFALSALTAAADTAGGGVTVSVSTIRDVLIEGSETFQLGISDLSAVPILELNSIATTTINDLQSDTPVMLDVVNNSINEDEADASFGFRIFFADGLTADEDVTVDWAVTCGNNPPGITNFDFDFTDPDNPLNFLCPSGEATILAGNSGVTTAVSIFNDTVVEGDEEFTLRLLGVRATNSDIFLSPPTEATYTIIDDDSAAVSLLTQPSISEAGGPTARISVSLNSEVDEDVTVEWEVVCGNVPGITAADFGGSCPTGTTTIFSNSFSDVISIDIADDDLIEGDETFTLNLTGLAVGAVGTNTDVSIAAAGSSADYTINDDDSGIISVTVNEPSTVSESAAPTVTFTVTLTGDSAADRADEDVNVRWSVTCVINPGVTAADFAGSVCPTGLATIPAGMDSDTFTIDIARDDLIEGNEPFTVSLTELPGIGGLGLSISPTQGMTTGSITDGDSGEISLTAITGEILEGETATFRVELGGGVTADENIGVPWSVTCGEAGSGITGDDFANPSECPASTVTILAGASSATFAVSTYDDADVEGVENFAVTLSSSLSTNIGGLVTVSDTVAGVDINDNDAVLLVFGNPVPSPVGEDSTVEFPLIFDPLLPSAVTLAWRIEGCSQTRTAGIDRFDFTNDACPSDEIMLPAGATNATVPVETADDDLLEGPESFRLEIVEMMSSLGTPRALTIINAFSPTVAITDTDMAEIRLEGPSSGEVEEGEIAQFTVTLGSGTGETSVADRDISVRWDIKCNLDGADNSEAADADFIQTGTCGSTGMLTINQGESAFSIDDVPTMDDTDFELDERFVMSLTTAVVIGGSGYDIRISSAEGEQTVLILNNDPQELGFRPSGSSALLATVRTPQRSAPESNEPPNAVKVVPDVLDSPDAPPPPRNVEFPYEPVSVRILGFDGSIQHTDPFYDGSRVCLSITEEARRAVRGRIVSLSLYRFNDTWERLENSQLDETDPLKSYICDTVDRFSGDFSRFALGYPAPVERSNLSILLPPTGGVTLSLWVLFGSGLLGLALVVSGGVFGLRRRR